MTEDARAADAVKQTVENFRYEAWQLAQKYVLDQNVETLDRIKELREAAELLAWSNAGRSNLAYDIDAVLG